MKDLSYTMTKVRETIYGLYPQTYCLSVNHLKSDKKIIEGQIDVRLLTGQTKRISVRFNLIKDELIIKELTSSASKENK